MRSSTSPLARRVAVLEAHPDRSAMRSMPIIAAVDCTPAQAIARHVAEHGPLPRQPKGRVHAIVLVPRHA